MRINKYLSQCGIASRRGADQLIKDKKVSVNGKILEDFIDIDPNSDLIKVNGRLIENAPNFVYLALHKPKGCISTTHDEKGRKTVMDFVPTAYRTLVKPIGRLDFNTEGLLLLTNDGDFARKLTLPENQIEKIYQAKIEGTLSDDELKKLRAGVTLDDGYFAKPKSAQIIVVEKDRENSKDPNFAVSTIEIVLTEGKNREIRRIFEALHKNVIFLRRVQIGPIRLGGLTRGTTKSFNPKLFD